MALIRSVRGKTPVFGENCFLAENATVVGEVIMGSNCTVWFNAVVRGDVHSITIGDDTNIQDGAIIHCTYQKAKTTIGSRVSIAHNAVVHGCTIERSLEAVLVLLLPKQTLCAVQQDVPQGRCGNWLS